MRAERLKKRGSVRLEPDTPDTPKEGAPNTRAKKGATKDPYRYPREPRSSALKMGRCHLCRVSTLTTNYDKFLIHMDPQPLSVLGEMDALLHKKKTWFIVNGNVYKRDVWTIKTSPAGLGGTVHQDHLCGAPQPTGLATNFPTSRSDDPGF